MKLNRRGFVAGTAAGAAIGGTAVAQVSRSEPMYGMIGRMAARPGQRETLIALLLDGVSDMPGCLSYVVAEDVDDPDAIWISEAWDSEAIHAASLSLPAVKAAIAKARPLIAGMDNSHVTRPIGGYGLK